MKWLYMGAEEVQQKRDSVTLQPGPENERSKPKTQASARSGKGSEPAVGASPQSNLEPTCQV